jgi:gas vesicle protein
MDSAMNSANERMLPGLGSFVVGIAIGVTLGLLFAQENGAAFRGKLARRLRALRALAVENGTGRRRRRPGEEDVSVV